MKTVILGGCGYIGSKLFTYLSKKKHEVDTVDLEWFGNFTNPKNIKSDYKDLSKSFFDKYDVVILLAGHSTVGMCESDIVGSLKNNVENFVALTQKLKKQKFIYPSTYRLYGEVRGHDAKETDVVRSFCFYDVTKRTIDDYISLSSLEYYSLRFATVNGFSPNLRVNQIINKLFLNARNNRKITVFDPLNIFSVLGIVDLCRVVEQVILGNDKRGIYNVGSFETSIHLIIKELSKIFENLDFCVEKPQQKTNHIRFETAKFQKAYNFKFKDTLGSTILSLKQNFSKESHTLKSL